MNILETDRLLVRKLTVTDDAFILTLLNEPSWLENIGDKGVRTLADAQTYIRQGPMAMYDRTGFGLYLVESKQSREPMGLCGLIKREGLDDVDLGFAFLSQFWGKGYAFEAATAVVDYGQTVLGISPIVAITLPTNTPSSTLLKKLGFQQNGTIQLPNDDEQLDFYVLA